MSCYSRAERGALNESFFRCDATANMGFGHMSRCLSLAEAFRLAEVSSIFVGLFDPGARLQIEQSGFDVIHCPDLVNTTASEVSMLSASVCADSILILDSYRVDEEYLSDLASLDCSIAVIDDFKSLSSYPCDVVLNFTWGAEKLAYPEGPVLLLGPDFFPARRQLVEARSQSLERSRNGDVKKLLVAIGGSDPKQIAGRVARLLAPSHSEICLHAIGSANGTLAKLVPCFAPGSAIMSNLPDLSEELLWADACITGGGLIKYESAFMGTPAAAISQNSGQATESASLAAAGLVFDLGFADQSSDEQLEMALNKFLLDAELREGLTAAIRKDFPPDPSANAAQAIIQAIRN